MLEYPATIAASIVHELEIKRSRFIAHIAPVASVSEADEVIAQVRKEHWDARHHCVAMVTGLQADQARSSDDGEPSGTAGVPMLEVLRRRELTDVVAVVSRYFGGVKLGAGGLVRAYGNAVSEAVDRATIVHRHALTRVTLEVPHADAGRYENLLRTWVGGRAAVLDEPVYASAVTLTIWAREQDLSDLGADVASWSAGTVTATPGETRVVPVVSG